MTSSPTSELNNNIDLKSDVYSRINGIYNGGEKQNDDESPVVDKRQVYGRISSIYNNDKLSSPSGTEQVSKDDVYSRIAKIYNDSSITTTVIEKVVTSVVEVNPNKNPNSKQIEVYSRINSIYGGGESNRSVDKEAVYERVGGIFNSSIDISCVYDKNEIYSRVEKLFTTSQEMKSLNEVTDHSHGEETESPKFDCVGDTTSEGVVVVDVQDVGSKDANAMCDEGKDTEHPIAEIEDAAPNTVEEVEAKPEENDDAPVAAEPEEAEFPTVDPVATNVESSDYFINVLQTEGDGVDDVENATFERVGVDDVQDVGSKDAIDNVVPEGAEDTVHHEPEENDGAPVAAEPEEAEFPTVTYDFINASHSEGAGVVDIESVDSKDAIDNTVSEEAEDAEHPIAETEDATPSKIEGDKKSKKEVKKLKKEEKKSSKKDVKKSKEDKKKSKKDKKKLKKDKKEDPTSVAGVMSAIKTYSDGTDIVKESILTFSDPDGSAKKGDTLVTSIDQALQKLKEMIGNKRSDTKNEKKNSKWYFKACPYKQFDKTLDETFMCFIKWAKVKKKNGGDERYDEYNVSKAFRRIESYAEWMQESSEDLVEPPLTAASVKEALDAFKMLISVDQDGQLVWWFDLEVVDKQSLNLRPEECLRAFVWYAHYILYDENAQENGMVIVQNCAKMGFLDMFTLMPMKLGAKLDRLTIGVLPIRCKKIYLLEEPGWMRVMMRFIGMFLSKKMKSRIVTLDKWEELSEALDEECIPKKFGSLEGKMEVDDVEKTFFSN